jgi:LETM1 and EF-hand domain-containing protein 1, mitochondrial
MRLEMAKFLQDTLCESGLKANAHILGSDAFKEFFHEARYLFRCPPVEPTDFPQGAFNERITVD